MDFQGFSLRWTDQSFYRILRIIRVNKLESEEKIITEASEIILHVSIFRSSPSLKKSYLEGIYIYFNSIRLHYPCELNLKPPGHEIAWSP